MKMYHISSTIAAGVSGWCGILGGVHAMERGVADRARYSVGIARPMA